MLTSSTDIIFVGGAFSANTASTAWESLRDLLRVSLYSSSRCLCVGVLGGSKQNRCAKIVACVASGETANCIVK